VPAGIETDDAIAFDMVTREGLEHFDQTASANGPK
jgi:hypothetical protein